MPLKSSVFIATSLDGFIARQDGDIDWLHDPSLQLPEGEDCGYGAFISSVDALVMGRKSFEKVLSFGFWPYEGTPVIVLSSQPLRIPDELQDKVQLANEEPTALVTRLESEGKQHLYIDGGETIRRFLKAGLIQEMTLSQIPIILGDGIPLFDKLFSELPCQLLKSVAYDNGIVQSVYQVKPTAEA